MGFKTIEQARDDYDKAIHHALELYEIVEAPARKVYIEVSKPAWDDFNKSIAPARKAYEKAVEKAQGDYCEDIKLAQITCPSGEPKR